MSYDNSFLTRAIALARTAVDEPSINAKYTDSVVIDLLESSYALILAEINRNTKTPVVGRITVTIASGTHQYALPHTIGSIYAIYQETSQGTKCFYDSRSRFNPYGRFVWVEGHTLHTQTDDSLPTGTEIVVEYIPSGTARLHEGTCTINSGGDEVTFGASPNAGTLDTHVSGYVGSIFRIIDVDGSTVTGNYIQERTISAYDVSTRVATLDVALDPVPTTDDGSIYYEIAPAINKGLDTIVSLYTAYTIASIEGNTRRANSILKVYRNQLRNLRLNAYYSVLQNAPKTAGDNYDNRRYRRIGR